MSKKLILSVVIIIIVIAISVWAFIVSAKITKDLKKESIESQKSSGNFDAKNLVIIETKDGQKYWEVFAASGVYDQKNNLVKLTKVKGNFYKDNNIVLSFDAPRGTYNEKVKEIKLMGGSRALTDKDVFITAKELMFAGKKDLIFANGNVRIKQSDAAMTLSDKSVFNSALTHLINTGNAQTFVYPNSKNNKL